MLMLEILGIISEFSTNPHMFLHQNEKAPVTPLAISYYINLRPCASCKQPFDMLRSLSLASRGYVSIAQQRTLARGFAAEAAEPQVQNPPKPRGDSEFVKRRRTYRQSLHEYRVAFQEEFKQIEERDLEKDHEKITAERLARLNRKRYDDHTARFI